MKITQFFFITILRQISLFFAIPAATLSNSKEKARKIAFKVHKGQVYDQNYKPRTAILFFAIIGRLVCHFKTLANGIYYSVVHYNEQIIKQKIIVAR